MKPRHLTDLLLLATIWGSSFLFMRLVVPVFGPAGTAWLRVAGAALLLVPLALWRGEGPAMRERAPQLLLVGLTNSALPFLCYAWAVQQLPSNLTAVFNAGTPLYTALLAWLWLGDRLTGWRIAGLVLGFIGVTGLALVKAGLQAGQLDRANALAVAACIAATLMYAHAACYSRSRLKGVPAMAMAAGSQLSATLVLAGPALLSWPAASASPLQWLLMAVLAFLCSGVAYILYFRLLAQVGATSASTVTFLVPVFAAAWGAAVLGEVVTVPMLVGGAVILAGTVLVLGLWPRRAAA